MNRYLIAALVLIGWTAASVLYGEHRVQVKWDEDNARQQAIADLHTAQDAAANKAIEDKHRKDVEYAKSQAGRSALAAWLKSHGLLPDGSPMPGSGGGKTDGAAPSDGRPDPESGLADRIKEFASKCRSGAQMNSEWREWAIREGLKVAD